MSDLDQFKYVEYKAGEKVEEVSGKKVDDASFAFVNQDKKIHDVKFTTKPTTFFKDAMRRFAKNKSSVVGGIILGILLLLALILPLDFNVGKNHVSVLPYDITKKHDYETNLPMKIFPSGTSFLDGTRTLKNQMLPYELNDDDSINYDHYIGEYDDEESIVQIKNVRTGYLDFSSKSGKGGYAKLTKYQHGDKGTQYGYMYFQPLKLDLVNNKYEIEFNLGTRQKSGYEIPEWAILLCDSQGVIITDDEGQIIDNTDTYEGNKNILTLTDYTRDYGSELEKENKEMTVTPHESIKFSLNDLISDKKLDSSITSQPLSVGFIIKSEQNFDTEFLVKNFKITGEKNDGTALKASDRSDLRSRSFGYEDTNVSSTIDANTLVAYEKDTAKAKYWNSVTDTRFDSADTYAKKCDLVIDPYRIAYGYKKGIIISMTQFDQWIDKGYITYKYDVGNINAPSTFSVTEEGEKSGEVFVKSVDVQTSQEDKDGKKMYSMNCTVLMYKYLGYSKMPVHVFGTDFQGKDMLKYVFSGLRTSLILGIIVAAVNIIIGVIWGSVSGYFGGATDIVMERITDVLSGIPWIVLMTVMTLKFGQSFGIFALSLCLTGWIGTASTTRSQFYRYRDREYVLASKTLGAKTPKLIFRHILPNAMGTIITSSILMIPSVIFNEANISYLGLGLKNLDSLGVILSDNQKFLSNYPSQLVIPAIVISLLMICFNLFGNGLRDAFNPSLKGTD